MYTKNKFPKKKSYRPWLIAVAVIAILAIVSFFSLLKAGWLKGDSDPSKESTTSNINFSPPTPEEKQAANDQKQSTGQVETNPTPNSGNKKVVKPIIVSAAGDSLRGFVPGIVENGGTCTAIFTNGTQTVTKTSSSIANAQNTTCTPLDYSGSSIGPGWKVILHYDSTTSSGASDEATVQ